MDDMRICTHHVGARNGTFGLADVGNFSDEIVRVLYDADIDCVEHIKAKMRTQSSIVLPYCIGKERSEGDFNISYNRHTSSLLEPNPQVGCFYMRTPECDKTLHDTCKIVEKRKVEVYSIDGIQRNNEWIPAPDFLSMNVIGSELDVIEGAKQAMDTSILGLEVNVSFGKMYRGQNVASDVMDVMQQCGYYLAAVSNQIEMSPQRRAVGLRGKGFTFFATLIFLKKIESLNDTVGEAYISSLYKLAFIALSYGFVEYAIGVLELAGDREKRDGWHKNQHAYLRFLDQFMDLVDEYPDELPPLYSEIYSEEDVKGEFAVRTVLEKARSRNMAARITRMGNRIAGRFTAKIKEIKNKKIIKSIAAFTELEAFLIDNGFSGIAIELRNNRRLDYLS